MTQKGYLTSREAATILSVSRATIYAYVSRGLIRSLPSQTSRDRLYAAEDVYALRDRKDRISNAEAASSEALHWGPPVFETEICSIIEGTLVYRGRSALALAEDSSLETTACLLWNCQGANPFAMQDTPELVADIERYRKQIPSHSPIQQALSLLPLMAEVDLLSYSTDKESLWRTGVRALRIVTACLSGEKFSTSPIASQLATVWGTGDRYAIDLLRASLVLCAEHEANTSSFAVRCIASTKACLYTALTGGLSAVQGPQHAGVMELVHLLFDELAASENVEKTVAQRLRRGENFPGFGHPLYLQGDPRALWLFKKMEKVVGDTQDYKIAIEACRMIERYANVTPIIYFALVALQRSLGLPRDVPLTLFTIGRTVGWIAHAIEQYQADRLIRPRARYIGPGLEIKMP